MYNHIFDSYHLLSWLDSKSCSNWFQETFISDLWPKTVGINSESREIKKAYASDLIDVSPTKYILEEIFVDYFWNEPSLYHI